MADKAAENDNDNNIGKLEPEEVLESEEVAGNGGEEEKKERGGEEEEERGGEEDEEEKEEGEEEEEKEGGEDEEDKQESDKFSDIDDVSIGTKEFGDGQTETEGQLRGDECPELPQVDPDRHRTRTSLPPTPQEGSLENLFNLSDGGYSSPRNQEDLPPDEGGKSFLTWESALEYLGKDHALLRPFQEAKKKQLLRERDHLLLQIRQSEQQRHDVENHNVKLGAQLYNLQEEVTRAQVNLDHAKMEREAVRNLKRSTEEALNKIQRKGDRQKEDIAKARESEKKLLNELSETDKRLSLVKVMASKCESDLTSIRMSLEGSICDKQLLRRDKDIQAFHLERMKSSLGREVNTLEILREAAERLKQEAEDLKAASRHQETELKFVERERETVEKAWEENVILMEKKSGAFSEALKSLISLRAEEAGVRNEVLNTKKEVKEKQLEHERATHRESRSVNSGAPDVVRENLIVETERKLELESNISDFTDQLDSVRKEYTRSSSQLSSLYKRIAMATERQRRLEDASFEKLSQQTCASKANVNIRGKIKQLKHKGRLLEDDMIAEEEMTAREALKVSNKRNDLKATQKSKARMQALLDDTLKDAEKNENELKRKQEKIASNANILDRLSKELEKLQLLIDQGEQGPPLEREQRSLQIQLKETEKRHLELEQEALSLQRDFLQNVKEKDALERRVFDLKNGLDILHDRSLRLKSELDAERALTSREAADRTNLNTAQRNIDMQSHQEKLRLEEATRMSGVAETEMLALIKELEKDYSEKREQVENLRLEVRRCEEQLSESLRERRIWEDKYLSAKDAKEEFLREKSAQGEMEAMKREINRMNVRWHALEASQKELSKRLAKTVDTEDALKHRVTAALENAIRNPNSAKATREMQIDSLKRRISKHQKALEELQQKTEAIQQQKNHIRNDLQLKQKMYVNHVKMLQEADSLLQEKLASKQMEQIFLQEERVRLRYLTALKENRYRSLSANNEEAQKALELSLGKRLEAYKSVLVQLTTSYPHLTRPLSAANRLLETRANK